MSEIKVTLRGANSTSYSYEIPKAGEEPHHAPANYVIGTMKHNRFHPIRAYETDDIGVPLPQLEGWDYIKNEPNGCVVIRYNNRPKPELDFEASNINALLDS